MRHLPALPSAVLAFSGWLFFVLTSLAATLCLAVIFLGFASSFFGRVSVSMLLSNTASALSLLTDTGRGSERLKVPQRRFLWSNPLSRSAPLQNAHPLL